MSEEQSLAWYGTNVLSAKQMREFIKLDRNELVLGYWIQQIPKELLREVTRTIMLIRDDFLGQKADARIIDVFISTFHQQIRADAYLNNHKMGGKNEYINLGTGYN